MARVPPLLRRVRLEFLVPVAIVVIVGTALAASGSSGKGKPPETVPVKRGSVVATVSAEGNVDAPQEVGLAFEGFGRLVDVRVKDGQRVRRGQVLASIEGAPQRAQLGSAQAALQSARARLDQTRSGLTPVELTLRTREADQARVALRNARRDLEDARRQADNNVAGLRRAVERAEVAGEEADLRESELRLANEKEDVDRIRDRFNTVRDQADADRRHMYEQLDRLRDAQNQDPPDQDAANDALYDVEVLRSKIAAEELDAARLAQSLETQRATVRTYIQEVDRDKVSLREARRRLGDASDNLRNGMAAARRDVDAARSSLATSQSQLQTTIARNRVDQQIKAADVAGGIADVAQAQSLVRSADKAVENTILRAPADGVVGKVNAKVGELTGGALNAPAGSGATPGAGAAPSPAAGPGASAPPGASAAIPGGPQPTEPLLTLSQVRGLQVKANFNETDAAAIHTGDPASVTVDAFPDRRLTAFVASIDPVETVESGVVSYEVTLVLETGVSGLRPGMSAEADISVAHADNVLTVPRTAVRSSQGANPSVIVVRPDGREEMRMVATGLQSDTRVQVLAGVGLNERVLRTISPPPDVG